MAYAGCSVETLQQAIERLRFTAGTRVTVALSGGLDSMCLLRIAKAWSEAANVRLSAHHIHHGLHPRADDWLRFCEQQCAQLQIAFSFTRVCVARRGGESLEAAARDARYTALAALDCEVLLFAHHLDDQIETFFLQLLRGAGLAGLAAMPLCRIVGHQQWWRPFLPIPRSELQASALSWGMVWAEDDSNLDTTIDRNLWRHRILPQIEARYPHYRQTIWRSQQHIQQGLVQTQALAAQDWSGCSWDSALDLQCWGALPLERRYGLLRYFLMVIHQLRAPAERWLKELARQLATAAPDAQISVVIPGSAIEVRRYRGFAYCVRPFQPPVDPIVLPFLDVRCVDCPSFEGTLVIYSASGAGLRIPNATAVIELRAQRGGERLFDAKRQRYRLLKRYWETLGVPPWQRLKIPLLFIDSVLVWAAGVGYSDEACVGPGDQGLQLAWVPNAGLQR